MIQAYFNERGYYITASKSGSRFIYELPDYVVNDAGCLYNHRWQVFNDMMDAVEDLSETVEDKDLELNTDSRLIEELGGELTPNDLYAKNSLQYFIEYDYVNFRRIIFQKCGAPTVNGKLSESIDTKRLETT